jgi:four helix bundle protein
MSTKPQSYRDLIVWQKSIELAKQLYRLTASFPDEEKFGMISQIRRAAVSVPSNIAEGQARNTTGEFIQFISHAEGSAAELDTQLLLSVEFGFLEETQAAATFTLIEEIRRMLNSLRRRLSENR